MILKIIHYPNLILNKKCNIVTSFEPIVLEEIINNMIETMNYNNAIGLAANQVAINKSIFVMKINNNTQYFINPVITSKNENSTPFTEGCLSFPGLRREISRPSEVVVQFQDIYGHFHEKTFNELEAICVQHEIDHLNGITFIDELKNVKKQMIIKKYLKNKSKQ